MSLDDFVISPEEQRARHRDLRRKHYANAWGNEKLSERIARDRDSEIVKREREIEARVAELDRWEESLNTREERLHEKWARLAYGTIEAEAPKRLFVRDIQDAIVKRFGLPREELVGHQRGAIHVYPRQLGMWLCARHTTCSLAQVGRLFGGRDHTTVMHARRKIEARYQEADPDLMADIRAVYEMLGVS